MVKINSNKEVVVNFTNTLTERQEQFMQTNAVATTSGETNLTAHNDMEEVFGNSLLHTDNYCSYLTYDIQNVLKIAGLFEEVDEQMKRQFEELE
ncbi:TIGR04197 family type VII secretion effector [Listeria weihenstephanensis]|uniref:TIGR04197 family type VII secretion effector n=1 Tax=Listeria weihenstephanensis TaxID=1006155 RepID=A0A841ZAA6_9LIST|nr:TIGR04197 family type VII secretion effector [Listeria weihenstephanensis]MBC1501416.1 TIGR04197 family type VII secretion effector [Listeria weihenstephanensis]